MNITISEVIFDLIINIINIAVLFLIVSLLVYKPVRVFLKNRSDRIDARKSEAEELMKNAEECAKKIELELKENREHAVDIINEAEHTAKLNADRIIEEANKDAGRIIEKARRETATEHNKMILSLNGEITQLAVKMSEKILKREISDADNAKIAEEFFSDENISAQKMLEQTAKRVSRAEKLAAENVGEEQ